MKNTFLISITENQGLYYCLVETFDTYSGNFKQEIKSILKKHFDTITFIFKQKDSLDFTFEEIETAEFYDQHLKNNPSLIKREIDLDWLRKENNNIGQIQVINL